MSVKRFDAVVVGAGVVGCGIAHALSERGLSVALLDRGQVGDGTSANSFAWINATSKVADEAYHRLNAWGLGLYSELAAEWGEARVGVHPTGALEWAGPDDLARLEALCDRFRRLDALGYPALWVGYKELAAMEPHLSVPEGAAGLLAPADAWLDVPRYLGFLSERIEARGSLIFESCEAGALVLDDDGKVAGLDTGEGRLHTRQVVLAAGPGTPEVLSALTGYEAFGARFPMHRAPGLLVRTPPTGGRRLARRVLYSAVAPELHARETPDGGLLLGCEETDGLVDETRNPEAMREGARELLRRAERLMPAFAGERLIDKCRLGVGIRPVPEDGHSIAGPLPGAIGLFVVATHSGVTLSLALGRLVAETIESGALAPRLAPFGLERFPGFV